MVETQQNTSQIINYLVLILFGIIINYLIIWLKEKSEKRNLFYKKKFEIYEQISSKLLSFILYIRSAASNYKEQPDFEEKHKELTDYIMNNNIFISTKLLDSLQPLFLCLVEEYEHTDLWKVGHEALEIIRRELAISTMFSYWKEMLLVKISKFKKRVKK